MFNFNCNHFSKVLSVQLLGTEIPKWIFTPTNILGYLCCCLPTRLSNGQWALEALIEEEKKRDEGGKELMGWE